MPEQPNQPCLAVCIPIDESVKPQTFRAIMSLDIPRPYVVLDVHARPVELARNLIVGRLLTDPQYDKVTHVLWLDADMIPPVDGVRRLLERDLPIVGGLCHGRRAPTFAPILLHWENDQYEYQYDFPRGLVEVDATGAAFLLVKRDVLEKIDAAAPGAEGPFSNRGWGEDVAFFERAREQGYKVYVDTTIEVKHIGEIEVDSALAKHLRTARANEWCERPKEPLVDGPPVASIVIPTWNQRPEWLRAAIKSACEQTVPVEIIVVDDGSDAPAAWWSREWPSHPRLQVIRIPHRGPWAALNAGIEAMTTNYFCWLSSDDTFRPQKVERQVRAMAAAGAVASFHGYDTMNEEGHHNRGIVVPPYWPSMEVQKRVLANGCYINGLTVMFHREVFGALGLFDASGDYSIVGDWEYWNRVGNVFKWLTIPEVLASRREGPSNWSTRYAMDPEKAARWKAENERVHEKYAPGQPWVYYGPQGITLEGE